MSAPPNIVGRNGDIWRLGMYHYEVRVMPGAVVLIGHVGARTWRSTFAVLVDCHPTVNLLADGRGATYVGNLLDGLSPPWRAAEAPCLTCSPTSPCS